MSAVGIVSLMPASRARDQRFRNDVAEIEGRLRFLLTEADLRPVFGGEPFHPGDRACATLALSRMHLHHVLDARACVLVLALFGDVPANLVSAVVRYLDARARPQLPVVLLAPDEMESSADALLLRESGELRAAGRAHSNAACAIRESDPRCVAFLEAVRTLRDDAALVPRDVGFLDDLRRHHHLAVCPGAAAPHSWRLPPLAALRDHGIVTTHVSHETLQARARAILGTAARPGDPRLVEIRDARSALQPGGLAACAVALAVRDVADESLAQSVALGAPLPAFVDPEAVASELGGLLGAAGRLAIPIATATGDDDSGAITQQLLQRASVTSPSQRFRDAQQARPADVAATLPIIAVGRDGIELSVPPAWVGSAAIARLDGAHVTCARIAFGPVPATIASFESATPARVAGDRVYVPLPTSSEAFLRHWPADRVAVIPGRLGERLAVIAAAGGLRPASAARWPAPRSDR